MIAARKAPMLYRGIIIPIVIVCAVVNTVCCSGQDTPGEQQLRKESVGAMSNSYVKKYADARVVH